MKHGKILSGNIYIEDKLVATFSSPPCPLFDFCNCKTGMCRAALPDDSCYWYRYFKALIKERGEEI